MIQILIHMHMYCIFLYYCTIVTFFLPSEEIYTSKSMSRTILNFSTSVLRISCEEYTTCKGIDVSLKEYHLWYRRIPLHLSELYLLECQQRMVTKHFAGIKPITNEIMTYTRGRNPTPTGDQRITFIVFITCNS